MEAPCIALPSLELCGAQTLTIEPFVVAPKRVIAGHGTCDIAFCAQVLPLHYPGGPPAGGSATPYGPLMDTFPNGCPCSSLPKPIG